jgi:hypothetical protein
MIGQIVNAQATVTVEYYLAGINSEEDLVDK